MAGPRVQIAVGTKPRVQLQTVPLYPNEFPPLAIGQVATGAPGSPALANVLTRDGAQQLDLTLPQGPAGDTSAAEAIAQQALGSAAAAEVSSASSAGSASASAASASSAQQVVTALSAPGAIGTTNLADKAATLAKLGDDARAAMGTPNDASVTIAKMTAGAISSLTDSANGFYSNYSISPRANRTVRSRMADMTSILDYDTTAHAIADPTRRLWVPRGTYQISDNVTIAADLIFDKGAIIQAANGVIVSITGEINAPMQQIFSGYGSFKFTSNNRNRQVFPEWWGATSGQNTDAGSINSAIQAVRGTRTSVHFSGGYTNEPGTQITFYPDMCATSEPGSEISGGTNATTGPLFAPGNYIGHPFEIPRLVLYNGSACVLAGCSLLDLRIPSIQACGAGVEMQTGGTFAGTDFTTALDNKITIHVISGIAQNATIISARENADVAQGNEFYINFATACLRATLFFAPGLTPNWDSNKFVFQAIDGNMPGASGLVAIAAAPVPRTIWRCETWFGGIPADGSFVNGAFAGLDMYVSLNDSIANYARWALTGPGNRIKSSFTGADSIIYGAPTIINNRAAFNGGVPISATAFTARITNVSIAAGTSFTFYVYSPYFTTGSNRPRISAISTNGLVVWAVSSTGNANEIAITVVNASSTAFSPSNTADFWVDCSGE